MTKILAWSDEGKLQEFSKLEVHERGLRHPAISVLIFCGDEVLLQRRALKKYHTPGLWTNTCCSHPNPKESTKSCSERRLNEELGIKNAKITYHRTIEYKAEVGHKLIENEVVDVFIGFVEEKSKLTIVPNPEEVMDIKWVNIDTLEKDIKKHASNYTPWLRIYVKDYSILRPQNLMNT